MGGINVKITMIQRFLKSIAPDLCYFCGKTGDSFCHHCKYDITHESVSVCFWCDTPAIRGVCSQHAMYIEDVRMLGWYEDGLERAIEGLKFSNDRFVAGELGVLLAQRAPIYPKGAVVVPIPTQKRAIRRRGYDQALLLAKAFAGQLGLQIVPALQRIGTHVQHEAPSKEVRREQVAGMYIVRSLPSPVPKAAVIVDDVITSGATIQEAARVLKEAGVERVFAAALAHPR